MHKQRQTSPRDMRQSCAQLRLVDHGESIDAGVNEKAFESRNARGRQTFDVLLVIAHDSGPRHPVHVALAVCSLAFRFERSYGCRRRQAIEGHVHEQGVAASGCGARSGKESFPFRAPGFVDVDVRVDQPRQNGSLAKILHGNMRGKLMWRDNVKDSPVFDEHGRGFDSAGRHYFLREKSLETHDPGPA